MMKPLLYKSVNARARARSLLETLAEASVDIRQGVNAELLEQERSLQQQLNAQTQYYTFLLKTRGTETRAAATKKELDALATKYQELEAKIRQSSPRYAALTQPQPITPAEIQQLLDPDTLLLEYSLGAERSYLWAVSPTNLTSYELPKGAEIKAAARQFYAQLTAHPQPKRTRRIGLVPTATGQDVAAAGTALSQMLLGPVAAQLGTKRLVIVASGALQYVPFAALPEPEGATERKGEEVPERKGTSPSFSPTLHRSVTPSPLIVNHEIVSLPSASTLAVLRRETAGRTPAPKTLAVIADPVFDDKDKRLKRAGKTTLAASTTQTTNETRLPELPSKLTRAARAAGIESATIPRLPGTRQEAEQLLALAPAKARLQALDFAANRTTATSNELSQYRIVHFATHGFLNSQQPEFSGIVLSLVNQDGQAQNGFLLAHEVYNLNLSAELVVLSACQTGLGKEIKGEGLVGLTRGFMYAGAPRVVVSLWSVNDRATAELMTRFYRKMLREGVRPAAALRAAQIEMWKQKQWEAPYYWAAFTLQGEWR